MFVHGRLIIDNIMVAFELIHYIKRKSIGKKEKEMALKIDINNAYDRATQIF